MTLIHKEQYFFCDLDDELQGWLERYIRIVGKNYDLKEIADNYLFTVDETRKEQLFYLRQKKFRLKEAKHVISEIYEDDEYMTKYMRGLSLSTFIWPQHIDEFRFFLDFIKHVTKRPVKYYLEIGGGEGLYASCVASIKLFSSLYFIDVSKKSSEIMRNYLAEYVKDKGRHYVFLNTDFMTTKDIQNMAFDVIVANEVIQSVDSPMIFLKKGASCLREGGYMYISTPVNSPMVDCVDSIDNLKGLEDTICRAGFYIEKKIYIPYKGYSIEQCEEKKLPINAAYMLRKEEYKNGD